MSDLIERLLNPRSFDHEALRKEAVAHLRELEDELDRLRAEKAELVEIIRHVVEHDPNRPGLHGEPIEILRSAVAMPKRWLADHANETETDVQEALPTAAEVRGILK